MITRTAEANLAQALHYRRKKIRLPVGKWACSGRWSLDTAFFLRGPW